jgi:hypothetical protein
MYVSAMNLLLLTRKKVHVIAPPASAGSLGAVEAGLEVGNFASDYFILVFLRCALTCADRARW